MKIVFMGTPDFSVGILKALYEADHEISLVVTQPDKPKGRSGKPAFSPVKEYAIAHGLEVFQPERLKSEADIDILRKKNADLFVVAAFGQILSEEVLNIPEYGCMNVHASLLPKYRGASPIQQALIDGQEITGVTIMQMDKGIDTGAILLQKEVRINKNETAGSLFDKLEETGSALIAEAVDKLSRHELTPKKQDEDKASLTKQIKKSMGLIDFNLSADEIERLIRAFDPWPGTYTVLRGKTLKIWSADAMDKDEVDYMPGAVIRTSKEGIYVKCGKGTLVIKELQAEGKKRMNAKDFLLGCRPDEGEIFG